MVKQISTIKNTGLSKWILFSSFAFMLLHLINPPSRPAVAQSEAPLVLALTADGPLTPAMAEYLNRGIRAAEREGAELLIFQLNTPGGSINLMNDMVESIRASRVPVVVYVAPRGAMAASAGTLITLAGHASAMAPETIIGAASPVGAEGKDLDQTMQAKEKNALKATVRWLAERRGEQAIRLAEQTIETAQAATANEALQVGLVDFIAADLNDLLDKLDGFVIKIDSLDRTLNTTGATTVLFNFSFIERLLQILTDPNIVFLLIAIGTQAILIEISTPGGWIAGFIGVVCLALATYGLGVLPVNWFGAVFLAMAFVLFILDIKAPTHGALTAAGVASLIIGALVLFNSPSVPRFQRVSVPLIVATSLVIGGIFFVILLFALRAQKAPIKTGQESLTGRVGIVRSDLAPTGTIQLGSELWTAELVPGEETLPKGARVKVVRVEGIHLIVKKG